MSDLHQLTLKSIQCGFWLSIFLNDSKLFRNSTYTRYGISKYKLSIFLNIIICIVVISTIKYNLNDCRNNWSAVVAFSASLDIIIIFIHDKNINDNDFDCVAYVHFSSYIMESIIKYFLLPLQERYTIFYNIVVNHFWGAMLSLPRFIKIAP